MRFGFAEALGKYGPSTTVMNKKSLPIFLLTDFGTRDPYVGVMKAVILARSPHAQIVDLGHEVAPQDIPSGAFQLMAAAPYLPGGAVVVAIVDPGVGSSRRILWARSSRAQYLAPDNGLLDWAAEVDPFLEARVVSARGLWPPEVSSTFHGRDIFAPVAAALNRGLAPSRLGPRVQFQARRPFPRPITASGTARGVVVAVDRFGNAITNLRPSDLPPNARFRFRGNNLGPLRNHYGEAALGRAAVLSGSWGFVELSIREGDFARRYRARPGDTVHAR